MLFIQILIVKERKYYFTPRELQNPQKLQNFLEKRYEGERKSLKQQIEVGMLGFNLLKDQKGKEMFSNAANIFTSIFCLE